MRAQFLLRLSNTPRPRIASEVLLIQPSVSARCLTTDESRPQHQDVQGSESELVLDWMARMRASRHIESDRADLSRFKQLYYTLPNRSSSLASSKDPGLPTLGQPISPGHHLILFPPLIPEERLNPDGTDPTYNSPPPYTRRMWAGGKMEFSPQHVVGIGEDVSCETTVESIERKTASSGDIMIFVNQLKLVRNEADEIAITERRTHVFLRPPVGGAHAFRAQAGARTTGMMDPTLPNLNQDFSFTCVPSPATLFRFSALTFNSHMIHLDPEFSRNVDGHPDRLVHGPLTALMLVDLTSTNAPKDKYISSFAYRARRPVIVSRSLTLSGSWSDSDGSLGATCSAENDVGDVCMTADINLGTK